MIHKIFTNKWIIGTVWFLLIFGAGCIWYYQHTTAHDREQAANADKRLQQWKVDKVKTPHTAEQESPNTPAESTTPTAEKPTNKIGEGTETNTDKSTGPFNIATPEQDNIEEVLVSPFGFGPYPEVPADYPGDYGRPEVDWDLRFTPSGELLTRVLVKLWTEGERNFRGGSTHNGKVYPHYYDTVYVRVEKTEAGRIIHSKSGPFVDFRSEYLDNPPAHLRILDLETSGIDPYQYLNLPK